MLAIVELTDLGAIRRRFVPGPGLDNVIVLIDHDGGSVPERRWILSDDLGSVAALTDRTGKAIRFNAYGPFGEPSVGNIGRMGWAGALTLPEIGMVHLRARAYAPNLGRFIQPDPIGTAGGINLYAYAGGDPVNAIDPLGLMGEPSGPEPYCAPYDIRCTNPLPRRQPDVIVVTAKQLQQIIDELGLQASTRLEDLLRKEKCLGLSVWGAAGAVALGVGDGLSFGAYSEGVALIPGGRASPEQKSSLWYKGPSALIGIVSGLRLTYATVAKTGSVVLDARGASEFRDDLKGLFSGLGDRHPRRKTMEQRLERYGTPERVRAAAGRTSSAFNTAAGLAGTSAIDVLVEPSQC